MAEQPQKFPRDVLILGLTAIVGLSGWLLNDRLRTAAKEQEFDDNAKLIVDLKGKLDAIPKDFVTRQEFDQVRQLIQEDHQEDISALSHLGDRIDHLAILDGLSPRSVLHTPVRPAAATMAKAKE